jgi:hypothetical protein
MGTEQDGFLLSFSLNDFIFLFSNLFLRLTIKEIVSNGNIINNTGHIGNVLGNK